ncbi:MAG: zinc carboxypeptidase [Pedobacter sp.]|nr:MAG: zinc carboxypeptidase [Pedobacter sp.]
MNKILLALLIPFLASTVTSAQIKTPSEFLGYELGTHFTPHQKVVDYYKYVAGLNTNMKLISYGKTYEGRELLAAVISAPEHMANLEQIRKNNLALSQASSSAIDLSKQPVILWLSYNVHGNEASSTETALKMVYTLSTDKSTAMQEWLKHTVVILDPCLNPDGRERYVNFYNAVSAQKPNPNPQSREHYEPWPRGRVNHYYYDLNRDWAWQTQAETQQRQVLYHQWMPEVHVDYHEQSYNSPYYFAPAAEPVHQDITPWQRSFQVTVGKNNAKYFDEKGWQYFTKERFDLLYPSYGDTYPLYNGAIGMTYEQGGINAGLAVITADGDTLTLKDRIDHHYTTGIATLEVVSRNAGELLSHFKDYFQKSVATAPGAYQSYVVKADNLARIKKLATLLTKNHIAYKFGSDQTVSGLSYLNKKKETYKIERNDLVINLHQPAAVLANVLMEPNTSISDSATYDITAWALPYAYGLNAIALPASVQGKYDNLEEKQSVYTKLSQPYAWVLPWESAADARALIALQAGGIKVRITDQGFTAGNEEFKPGSLLIYRLENERVAVANQIATIEKQTGLLFKTIGSGFVDQGKDLGSGAYGILQVPKIAVLSGPETSSQGVGEIWHFFEQELGYPVTMISTSQIRSLDMSNTTVLIVPDGSYSKELSEQTLNWVEKGGKLILMEEAIAAFADKKSYGIKKRVLPPAGDTPVVRRYNDKEDFSDAIPGAIYKVNLDQSHPLAFGLGKYYYTLKTDDKVYEQLEGGYNVGTLSSDAYVSGLAGKKVRAKLEKGMLFGAESIGKGSVVYLSGDVLFRSFWESGKQMFINGLLLAN